jgi:hypothetical protein
MTVAGRLSLAVSAGRAERSLPLRAAWQRDLGTIDPGSESAVDARDVRRGDMLHQQLAALPTGPAAVRAPIAVFGRAERSWVRHSNRCPWVRQCEPRQPAIGKRPALGDRGASVRGLRRARSALGPSCPSRHPTAQWRYLPHCGGCVWPRCERNDVRLACRLWRGPDCPARPGSRRWSRPVTGGRPTSTQREAPRPVTWAGPSLMSLRGPTSRLARVAVRDGA